MNTLEKEKRLQELLQNPPDFLKKETGGNKYMPKLFSTGLKIDQEGNAFWHARFIYYPQKHAVLPIGYFRYIRLTSAENRLMQFLTENAGRILTKNQILNTVFGSRYYNSGEVKKRILRLRNKLDPARSAKTNNQKKADEIIVSERGVGYRLKTI